MDFMTPDIVSYLDACDASTFDSLPFGAIAMAPDGVVERYNLTEARMAGLSAERVVGKHFFTEVAPCTNNYLVASRFEECAALDECLPYVFTLRMRPRNVELRLVKSERSDHQYLLVRNR